MNARRSRTGVLLGGLAAAAVALVLVSLAVGRAPLALVEVARGLLGTDPGLAGIIVEEIRLPRALLAAMVGASLGLAGAALQGLLRNPLAEPGVIGVSGCAALGAVLAFYTGLGAALPLGVPIAAMAGALAAVAVIHLLAGRESSLTTLILAGVAVNAMAGALTALVLNLSPNPFAAYEMMFWLMGSLADRSFEHVALAAPLMAAGWVALLSTGRALEVLSLGDDAAATLGVRLGWLRLRVIGGTALAVGAAVSVSGVVGFVGLVVPHLLRPRVAHRPALLLPASALGGAVLTLAADVAVRVVSRPPEIQLGVLTALIGAPFFLHLVVAGRRSLP